MSKTIIKTLETACRLKFEDAGYSPECGIVTQSDRPDLAPFQCNGALVAAGQDKRNGKNSSPRDIAQLIAKSLETNLYIEEVEVAGPGFINIIPSKIGLTLRANHLYSDENVGATKSEHPENIIVDYGGPNVAKPMHVGHLRSAVIGDCLKRLLKFLGNTVHGDIHLGDWGLQMGHLITELEIEKPHLPYFDKDFSGPYLEPLDISLEDLEEMYPRASKNAAKDLGRKEKSRIATAELQAGRPGYRALLKHFIAISKKGLEEDYNNLGVSFEIWKGESDVEHLIPSLIQKLKDKQITEKSDGALVVRVAESDDKKEIPPLILVSSSGASLYGTTDLATIVDRKQSNDPDRIIYVVDQRQAQHFEQVFRVAKKAELFAYDKLEHIGFGTVNGEDGKPFKTREGGVLRLARLVNLAREAAEKAYKRLVKKDIAKDMHYGDLSSIAEKVGLAAIKFADLQNPRTTNYIFDVNKFTSFEGKTGPYLLYARVRSLNMIKKARQREVVSGQIFISHQAEVDLLLQLDGFDQALHLTNEKRSPHILCDHVYNLAQVFSKFYAKCNVIDDNIDASVSSSRLSLAELTKRQLDLCLDILGIEVLDKM